MQLSTQIKSTALCLSLQLTAHADRVNVKDTKQRAVVYDELQKKQRRRTKHQCRKKKTKQWYKTGKQEEDEELRVTNHDI